MSRQRRAAFPARLLALLALMAVPAIGAQPEPLPLDGQAWRRIPVRPGGGGEIGRPRPPRSARGARQCIDISGIAAAQLIGDRAIELTLKGGRRWRLILAEECPALSFYQGFYYQQRRTGQLCAGRDSIGARSGGECGIAAIVPLPPAGKRGKRR